MIKKLLAGVMSLFLSLTFMTGCDVKETKPDFGTEVINDTVQLPEIVYKEDLLACYAADGRTVYTLGTRHSKHFYPQCEYSLLDIQSVIDNVNPDYVFIECREEIFKEYQVLDGPQEFQFIYAYCQEKGIQVELIDWYLTDNEAVTKRNSTSDERDNQIFYNIYDKMEKVKENETVLICYGDMHFYFQQPRMERAGWERVELEKPEQFFVHTEDMFQYPEGMTEVLQNCIDYFEKGFMEEAEKNVTDLNALQLYKQLAKSGAKTYKVYKKMAEEQRLYYTEEDLLEMR